jgi:hypothetical protein
MTTDVFTTADEITFGFDEWRRLTITMLPAYRPLAAWLHTDVQPNLAALDTFVGVLGQADRDGMVVNGNGCAVAFPAEHIMLTSLYDHWSPLSVPRALFWPALTGLRAFVAEVRGARGLARPLDYPLVSRDVYRHVPPEGGPPVLVDHTYFPRHWSPELVREAGEGAWRSQEAWYDSETGAWSGLWRGLEVAGYFDPATGSPQTYFPVLAP